MNKRPTPETDNNEYAHTFLEQYGYESSLQDAPVDWPDFARRLERERDEWKAKYIQQNKDLGCEMMDPNGTIWDHAKKLQDENKDIKCKFVAEISLSNQLAGALMVTRWDSYTICKEAIFAWKDSRDLQ